VHPLHNPPNITGIEACQKILPGIPMAGTFDTAFHQTMPAKAYIYPIPYEYYRKNRIRRYGFHGTSHFYVAKQGAKAMGKKLEELKIITCHLGNGSSMAAIQNGVSIDTSMGYTPLEGLPMGTRCGDLDPAIPLVLQRTLGLSHEQVDAVLNRKSGMLGISEVSSDMRDINEKAAAGHAQAKLALEIFAYRIKKYIGAYIAAMNGVDLVIFTAGIGERGLIEREMILEKMEFLGIVFDKSANQEAFGKLGTISKSDSRVRVMVIPTNEELEIAEQTLKVIVANQK
jgi:acetate kinase